MPADYVACRDSLIKKGVSEKTAKRRCAIWFYKKHGVSVNEAHKKGEGAFPDEPKLDEDDWASMELMSAKLEDIGEQTQATKADTHGDNESLQIEAINMDFLEEFGVLEIVSTKVRASAYTSAGEAVLWTERALKKAAPTWKFGNVSVNHNGKTYGKIIDSFFENDCLKQTVKVNAQLKEWLKNFGKHVGVSIEATDVKINKKMDITNARGTGVTFVFPPETPACKQEEGCAIMGTETEAVHHTPPEAGNMPEEGKKIMDRVYNECRKKYSSESAEDKTRCSKIAWYAVKKAGFEQDGDKWVKSTKPIEMIKRDEELEKLLEEFESEEETPVNGVISTSVSNPWFTITDTSGGNYLYPDTVLPPGYIITYTTGTNKDAPNNINEENKNPPEIKSEDIKAEQKVDNMVEEQKPETICAKKHEAIVKEKDSEIEAHKKEIESLKATVAKFEAEHKAKVLERFASETGLDAKAYESKDVSVLEDIMATLKALKEKESKEPEVNSGATVVATEQKNKPEGDIVTATISEAEKKAKEEAEEIARLNAKATDIDGVKR